MDNNRYISRGRYFVSGGAKRIQKRAIEVGETLKFNPFRSYIKSPTYVTVARIGGAASIIVALLLLVLVIRGK